MKPIDVIILAGGFGKRLESVAKGRPKALMPCGEGVFLDCLLRWLARYSIRKVFLSLHYGSEQFESYLKQTESKLVIEAIKEPSPLGTGGALKFVLQQAATSSSVFLINGDTLLSLNLDSMHKKFEQNKNALASLALCYVKDTARYGRVEFKADLAQRFTEKGTCGAGWINSGCCIIRKSALQSMPRVFSIERDLYPELVKRQKLMTYKSHGIFLDIGVPQDYKRLADYV